MDPVIALLAKMDERLARQDEMLERMDARSAAQDAMLAGLNGRAVRQEEILAQMGAILLEMRASTERVSQHGVQIAGLCTEHTLHHTRLMEVSQRLLDRVEARR